MIFEFLNHEQILPELREAQKSAISPIVVHLIETIADVGWAPEALIDGTIDALPRSEWRQHEQTQIIRKHLQAALDEIRQIKAERRFDEGQLDTIRQFYTEQNVPAALWPPEVPAAATDAN